MWPLETSATCPLVHAVPFPQPAHLRWLSGPPQRQHLSTTKVLTLATPFLPASGWGAPALPVAALPSPALSWGLALVTLPHLPTLGLVIVPAALSPSVSALRGSGAQAHAVSFLWTAGAWQSAQGSVWLQGRSLVRICGVGGNAPPVHVQ